MVFGTLPLVVLAVVEAVAVARISVAALAHGVSATRLLVSYHSTYSLLNVFGGLIVKTSNWMVVGEVVDVAVAADCDQMGFESVGVTIAIRFEVDHHLI